MGQADRRLQRRTRHVVFDASSRVRVCFRTADLKPLAVLSNEFDLPADVRLM
jgi:hypothetical protein